MNQRTSYDAVIIGSGPNGLAAGIELARNGYSVVVFEAEKTCGGGVRSAEVTLPGFVHDLCSSVHPLTAGSPYFSRLPLAEHGLRFIYPQAAVAHPFDDGTAVVLERSVEATSHALGRDGPAYQKLMEPLVADWNDLVDNILGPPGWPSHPILLARFGLRALRSARALAESRFRERNTRAFFAGLAAHSSLPLEKLATAAFGLVLGVTGHAVGWPVIRKGSGELTATLVSLFHSFGGELITDRRISKLEELPEHRVVLCDITPRQLLRIAGHRLPARFQQKLRGYRYGPAAFKIDWALDAPVPWTARDCLRAATVHLGGTLEEIAQSERAPWRGEHAGKPFVLVAQPSLFDPTRVPVGKQTLWAYCHVPNGSTVDMTEAIETQIERFAPGFRKHVLDRKVTTPKQFEQHNENLIGGDINGGAQDLGQLFLRPTASLYRTPLKEVFICSSSTPPGGGVHGMCGFHAARCAIRCVLEAK